MTSDIVYINAASKFSKEVFRLIRPSIPRERWPNKPMTITFSADPSGLFLLGNFEGDDLPPSYAATAVRIIAHAGVDLVVLSPFAVIAAAAVKAKRWRDAFLYLLAPLLFAIPLLGALNQGLMMVAAGLFGLNLIALAAAQASLVQRRAIIAHSRFVAEIPVPGSRVTVPKYTGMEFTPE